MLVLKNAKRRLRSGHLVLDGLDLEVGAGESVSIIGRSGSGKSTLLAGLALVSPFDHGTQYCLDSTSLTEVTQRERARIRGSSIGFVLQNSGLVQHLTALENVRLPLLHSGNLTLASARRQAYAALEQFGVESLAQRRPTQLSGGERQRVAIARAMVTAPKLILADEPTGALDEVTGKQVMEELLTAIAGTSRALVIVTHDPEVAEQTNRILQLSEGRLGQVTAQGRSLV